MRLTLFLFFVLISNVVAAQDTVKKVSFKIGAEFWGTYLDHAYNPNVKRPAYLQRNAGNEFDRLDTLKDSPLKHGAYYAAVKTVTTFTPAIQLKIDLYAEHRGISYGVYNRKSIAVYPVIQLQVKDSFYLFKSKLIVDGNIGYFLDTRLDEGLFIYNLDAQGGEAKISMGKWKLSATWYGDLSLGIGLGIDDVIALSASRIIGKRNDKLIGFSVNSFFPPDANKFDHLYYSMFFHHSLEHANIYAQAGFQGSAGFGDFYSKGLKPQSALLIGGNVNLAKRKVSYKATLEARYYGSSVNFFHTNGRLRYRDENGGLYANNAGEYLYPLRKYDSPFSQWAVFTEYFACDVFSTGLTGNISYDVSKKTEANFEYDLNYIAVIENKFYNPEGMRSEILYSFLTAGFYYTPIKNFKAGIILSNKGMNLNLGYPTFFEYKNPYLGFKIRCTI